jgi:beta-N-acetylhexosaminidase
MALIEEFAPAGLVFFSRNYPDGGGPELTDQFAKLNQRSLALWGRPLILALDDEGGTVKRLPPPYVQLPGAPEQAERGTDYIQALAFAAGLELRDLGFNLNFAPVLDLLAPSAFMAKRAYSNEPFEVFRMARAFTRGFNQAGLYCCGKHFPGLGAAKLDPHEVLPTVDLSRDELAPHLEPFALMIESGLQLVMTGHCRYPGLGIPGISTFSPELIDLLRGPLGFQGLVLSDDLEMGAVVKNGDLGQAALSALLAGHDLLLVCRKRDLIEAAYTGVLNGLIGSGANSQADSPSRRRIEAFLAKLGSN